MYYSDGSIIIMLRSDKKKARRFFFACWISSHRIKVDYSTIVVFTSVHGETRESRHTRNLIALKEQKLKKRGGERRGEGGGGPVKGGKKVQARCYRQCLLCHQLASD